MNALKEKLTQLRVFRWWQEVRRHDETGQSIIILTFAFVGLIAMLGLALDLGLVYVNRVAMSRAIDSAALAAAPELPIEEESMRKAINFLMENGYRDANYFVAGCIEDRHNWGPNGQAGGGDDYGSDKLINTPNNNNFWNNLQNGGTKPVTSVYITDTLTFNVEDFYLYTSNELDTDGKPIYVAENPTFFLDARSYQARTNPHDTETGLHYEDSNYQTYPGCGNNFGADPDAVQPQRLVDEESNFGSASRLRVRGIAPVRMNFMQFFGFDFVNVVDQGVAQNSANLDVALVMDRTGSMEFETICYGCWERAGGDGKYEEYPRNGTAYPLPYGNDSTASSSVYINGSITFNDTFVDGGSNDITYMDYFVCGLDLASNAGCMAECESLGDVCMSEAGGRPDLRASAPLAFDNDTPADPDDDYIIIEAELAALNSSTWDPAARGAGQGYWALQRINGNSDSIDNRGASMRHHPYRETSDSGDPFGRHYKLEDAEAGNSPRLEYDFVPTWTGQTHLYMRGMGFRETDRNTGPWNEVFWAVSDFDAPPPPDPDAFLTGPFANTAANETNHNDWDHTDNAWTWVSLGTISLTQGQKYTLKLFAGSAGYSVDRVAMSGPGINTSAAMATLANASDPSPGSAQRQALDMCNPVYGLSVAATNCSPYYNLSTTQVNNLLDPLFGDEQPLRGAMEAMKDFVERLDPDFDQAGFVRFSSNADQMAQLECLTAASVREQALPVGNRPGWPKGPSGTEYDETNCNEGDENADPAPVRYQVVLAAIEDQTAGGNTDIADGLRRGLNLLGINTNDGVTHDRNCEWTLDGGTWEIDGHPQDGDGAPSTSHCARGAVATQIIVLLTDGAPTNDAPGDNNNCRGVQTDVPEYSNPGNAKYDCIMYYAKIARQQGVVVYTIGLGAGADPLLLGAVASHTNGEYYFAPSSAQLNIIFNTILSNVYIRLVQ